LEAQVANTQQAERADAATRQSVLWLCGAEPSPAVARQLAQRGMALCRRGPLADWPAARLSPLGMRSIPILRSATLEGRRIAVQHSDPERSCALAQALAARGAEVMELGRDPGLTAAETFDPDAVAVDVAEFVGASWSAVSALWQHPRLRWAPVLLMPQELMGADGVSTRDAQMLGIALEALDAAWHGIAAMAVRGKPFTVPINALGPARTLRALLSTKRALRARFMTEQARIEVDLAGHEVCGARAHGGPGEHELLIGTDALVALLDAEHGSVRVCEVACPTMSNVMAPLSVALERTRDARSTPPARLRGAASVPPMPNASPSISGIHAACTAVPRHELPPREESVESATRRVPAELLAEVIELTRPSLPTQTAQPEVPETPERGRSTPTEPLVLQLPVSPHRKWSKGRALAWTAAVLVLAMGSATAWLATDAQALQAATRALVWYD
jgi:hypothetical protein